MLLLDEPTNHLDIPAREALENSLKEFDGTLLFVSHDRMFLSKMANRILEIDENGNSHLYSMSYDEYTQKKKDGTLVEAPAEKQAGVKKSGSVPASEKEKPESLTYEQRNSIKNRVARLEKMIEEAEADLEALEELKYEPEYYQDFRKMEELEADIDQKKTDLDHLNQEWEEKSLLLEG